MLKTAAPLEKLTLEKIDDDEGGDDIDDGSGVEIAKKSGKSKGQETSKSQKSAKSQKLSKSGKSKGKKLKKLSENKNLSNFDAKNSGLSFLTPKARSIFNCLRLAFIKAPILRHFYPEYYIRIEINVSGYAISGMLSQLASGTSPDEVVIKTDLSQWHLVAFFSRKIIPVETWYETHDNKLLAIIEAFKTWRYYLEGCKYKVLVLTDHNNLRHFMDMKSLSSR